METKLKNPKLVRVLLLILVVGILLELLSIIAFKVYYKYFWPRYYGDTQIYGATLYALIELYGIIILIYFLVKKYSYKIWLIPTLNLLAFIIPLFMLPPHEGYNLPNVIQNIFKIISIFLAILIIIQISWTIKVNKVK